MARSKDLQEAKAKAEKDQAIALAWATGRLRYKLDINQRKVYDAIEACEGGSFYFNKPRRVGGSFLLVVRAVEQCLRKPNAQIRYAAPTSKALRKIVIPNLRKVLEDMPIGMERPKWSTIDGEYRFHNGSILALAGCDNQRYEDLRGTEADEIYMDEVGFIDELDYILQDVLLPQVQDTGGKVILISTPPRSATHPAVELAKKHMNMGQYYTCTVWDNPRKTRAQHEKFFRRLAGDIPLESFYRTTMFRREYLAEIVTDETRAVIPEWTKLKQIECIRDVEPPSHYDAYVGIDLGWRDGSAFVLGYWDFTNARLVVTDEHLVFRTPLDQFQQECQAIEARRLGPMKAPLMRVSDNDILAIQEMNRRGWTVRSAAKHDKELAINQLRELIRDGKFILSPSCKLLDSQLQGTIWNKHRTSFERSSEGHGDLLDALIYMYRCVLRYKDPMANVAPVYDFDVFKAFDAVESKKAGLSRALDEHVQRWGVA